MENYADYIVHFKIYLKQSCLPEGWVNPLTHDSYIRATSFEKLKELSNREAMVFVKQQGVIVLRPTNRALADDIPTMDLMRFIPMQMIAYIDRETQLVAGVMPDKDDEGGVIYQ